MAGHDFAEVAALSWWMLGFDGLGFTPSCGGGFCLDVGITAKRIEFLDCGGILYGVWSLDLRSSMLRSTYPGVRSSSIGFCFSLLQVKLTVADPSFGLRLFGSLVWDQVARDNPRCRVVHEGF